MRRRGTKRARRTKLWEATAKQRALTHYYRRPIREVVLSRIEQGQPVTQIAEAISRESSISVGKTALYRWIDNWQEEQQQAPQAA